MLQVLLVPTPNFWWFFNLVPATLWCFFHPRFFTQALLAAGSLSPRSAWQWDGSPKTWGARGGGLVQVIGYNIAAQWSEKQFLKKVMRDLRGRLWFPKWLLDCGAPNTRKRWSLTRKRRTNGVLWIKFTFFFHCPPQKKITQTYAERVELRSWGIQAFRQGMIFKGKKRLAQQAAAEEESGKKKRKLYFKNVRDRDLIQKGTLMTSFWKKMNH